MSAAKFDPRIIKKNPPPSTATVRAALRAYLDRSGLVAADVAPDIGYKRSSVDHFLRGSYGKLCRDQIYMRHAVSEFLNRQPVQDDEEIPTKLLPTHDTKLILERIQEAHSKHRIVVIEGPPGTCKTTTLRWYEAERNRRQRTDAFYVRAFTQITGHGLLKELAVRVGAYAAQRRERVLRNLVRKLRARKPSVLLVDEAQNLLADRAQAFEQLRDVIDMAGCGCVLVGHFNFVRHLSNGLGRELEQWLSRIDIREHLKGLQDGEVDMIAREYLGAPLSPGLRKVLVSFAHARDRNAGLRAALVGKRGAQVAFKYLSIRRVRKFFERIDELRAIEQNRGASVDKLARGALKQLVAPAGRAL